MMKPFQTARLFTVMLCALAGFFVSNASAAERDIPIYTYKLVHVYPHDPNAFTQGLFYLNGFLYESTGLLGRSSVRKVVLQTGDVVRKMDLSPEYFGEGITYWGKRLIGVTWKSHVGFAFDLNTFAVEQRFSYAGEGWGLTRNGQAIIMSDGTSELRFLNPQTLQELRRVRVTAGDRAVDQLNELEWIKGEVFANIWQTNLIARIDPQTGKVVGWIDLSGILPPGDRIEGHTDVLNGIAYDAATDRLFVTGKLWPKLFEIRLLRKPDSAGRPH
jgi:glutaminyl-peptide cyclotransferase